MSQKYPEGAVIVSDGARFKVLECVGEIRFLGNEDGSYSFTGSAQGLEKYGWTVEEAPWKPEKGEKFACIRGYGDNIRVFVWDDSQTDRDLLAIGNCYQPDSQALKDAQARVLKAYKG